MDRYPQIVGWLFCLAMLALPAAAAAAPMEAHVDDVDGDGVFNDVDRDTDNDGIADTVECGSSVDCSDVDGDGITNKLDLDSDGDGITDAHEAFGKDADGDGRYDDFEDLNADGADDLLARLRTPPIDTDGDGTPDFLQIDSDGDGFLDAIEGHDADGDGVADRQATGVDLDQDGLDDAFDDHCIRKDLCRDDTDLGGTPAPTPDHDGDGIEDFRDPVDDSPGGDAGGDAGPDAGPDAGSDAGVDAGPDVGFDAGSDVGSADATGEVDTGSNPDTRPDVGQANRENDLYISGGGCSSVPASPGWASVIWLAALVTVRRRRARRV